MIFEFDPDKSITNQVKHEIDFVQSQMIWNDTYYIEIPLTTTVEVRFLVIGMINGKYWSGIITKRGESTRIISIRRSRKEEIAIYES